MKPTVAITLDVFCSRCGTGLEARVVADVMIAVEPCERCMKESHIDGIGDALDNTEPINMVQFANTLLRGPI